MKINFKLVLCHSLYLKGSEFTIPHFLLLLQVVSIFSITNFSLTVKILTYSSFLMR